MHTELVQIYGVFLGKQSIYQIHIQKYTVNDWQVDWCNSESLQPHTEQSSRPGPEPSSIEAEWQAGACQKRRKLIGRCKMFGEHDGIYCMLMVQVRTVCREALHVAENVIHPRLPVVGVEALSRCIAERHSQAVGIDAVPSVFGHEFELGVSDDQSDGELNQDNVADVEVSDTSGNQAASLSPMESRNTLEHLELPAGNVCSPSEDTLTEAVEMAALADVDVTSPSSGQEKSDAVSFAASPNLLSPSSRTVLNTLIEGTDADEMPPTCPTVAPTTTANSGSDTVEDKLLECSQSEPQESLRKRRYSATSNDGDDSESESGEIEV